MRKTLQHPRHEHVLILQFLSRVCKLRCDLCGLYSFGPIYSCEKCDFFLHGWCSHMPNQIQHPYHPRHPLTLDADFKYRCHESGCRLFELDPASAILTLPPKDQQDEKEPVECFPYHDHPLTFFDVRNVIETLCNVCEVRIKGPVYGCRRCIFLLHESCARLPHEIECHPFHPHHPLTLVVSTEAGKFKCRCCNNSWKSAYCCSECNFSLDFNCATSALHPPDQKREESLKVDHFLHPHQLVHIYLKERNSYISCKFCELPIRSGDVYSCLEFECSFMLHKSCAEVPRELAHPLHPDHPLIFQPESHYRGRGQGICDACQFVISGYVFSCNSCKFDLDPRCALRTLSAFEEGASVKIRHFAHEEHLMIVCYIPYDKGLHCTACMELVGGLAYCCHEEPSSHRLVLHRSCAELPSILKHPFHPPHPLTLLSKSSSGEFYCGACRQKSEGYAYHCAECGFHLDVQCAQKCPSLIEPCHRHELAYFEKTKYLRCTRCGHGCNDDLYRCVPCNFNIHHDCLPLPPVMEHECHPYHPLKLRDKVIGLYDDEHYCDVCENSRNPEHAVYYCEECEYIADVECIISEVRPERGRALAGLDEEITRVQQKIGAMEANLQGLNTNLKALESMREQ